MQIASIDKKLDKLTSFIMKVEKHRDPAFFLTLAKEQHTVVVKNLLPEPCNSLEKLVALNTVLQCGTNSISLV